MAVALALSGASVGWAHDLQLTGIRDTPGPGFPNSGPDPSPAGGVVQYDITYDNGSPTDPAANSRAIFELPTGTTLASGSSAGCTPDGARPTRVTCTLGTVAALGSGSLVIRVDTQGLSPSTVTLRGAIGNGTAPASSTALPLANGDAFFASDTNAGNNNLSESTTLTNASNLEVTKVGTPDPVNGGADVTWTVTVRNLGPSTATGVVVTDTLPAGTDFVEGSLLNSGADTAGTTFSQTSAPPGAGGSLVASLGGTLANGGTAVFSFRAKVLVGSGNIVNGVGVTSTSADPIQGNNTDTETTNVSPGADLAISKTVNPAPAVAGDLVTYTIRPRNLGPSTSTTVSFIDTLPNGFTIATPPTGSNWTCAGAVGAGTFSCTRASFPAGANDDVTVVVAVPSAGPGSSGNQTNTATIGSADTPDAISSNDTGTVDVTVLPDGADLELAAKTKTPLAVLQGQQMTSVIDVRNLGPRTVTANLTVTDELSPNESFVSASGPWTCANNTPASGFVRCTFTGSYPVAVGTLLNGANALTIRTQATSNINNTAVNNTACTGGSGGSLEPETPSLDVDANTANDCAGAGSRSTTEVSDLSIAKSVSTPGGDALLTASESTITYTLVVSNAGPNATTGVVVNDPIPGFVSGQSSAAITQADAPFGGAACAINSGSLVCNSGAGSLASGASATIVFTVSRPLFDSVGQTSACTGSGGLAHWHCNTAGVGIDLSRADSAIDSNGANNASSIAVQVDRVANVRTTAKTPVGGATAQNGVNKSYTLSYLNAGPSPAPDQVFRDTFTLAANDPGFVLISASRTPGSVACTATTTGTVAAAAAPGGTSYTGGASGGTVVLRCPRITLANNQTESMSVVIRPNNGAARSLSNLADFFYDANNDGNADPASGTDANGSFNFNGTATPADDERSATLSITGDQIDLLVNKIDLVDPLAFDASTPANNRFVYRVTVLNQGPSIATNVSISDVLAFGSLVPAGRQVQFVGDSTASTGPFAPTRCNNSGSATSPAALTTTCAMPGAGGFVQDGVIAAGATSELFLQFEYLTAPGSRGDTVENTATASASESETNPGNNVEGETTTIRSRADVAVSKIATTTAPSADPTVAAPASAASVTVRQPFFYVLDGVNNGPGSSLSEDRGPADQLSGTGTVVTDTLPVGLRVTGPITWQKAGPAVADATPNGSGTCTPPAAVPFTVSAGTRTVTCNVGDLTAAGGSVGRVRVVVPAVWNAFPSGATGTTTATSNAASIATQQLDPVPANNSTSSSTNLTRATLSGTVFQDRDRAGANGGVPQAAGAEPRISGVALTLTGTDAYGNAVSLNATTDANGDYSFTDLAPSNAAGYAITQTQPAGFVNGPVAPPAFGAASGPSLTAGTPSYSRPDATGNTVYGGIVVGTNEAGVRYNFPEVRRPSLSGVIYVDRNFNNSFTSGTDDPIPGSVVNLYDAANPGVVLATTTTDGGGAYSFTNLDPLRTYFVEQPLPTSPATYANRPSAVNPGLVGGAACVGCAAAPNTPAANTDRITGIDLSSGADGTQFNFGEDEQANTGISGFVYVDRNNNGSFENGGADAGTVNSRPNGGLQGVTITLTAPGQPTLTTVTDANGRYAFLNLVAGVTYTVTQTQPAGFANGTQNAGNAITVSNLPAAGSNGNSFGERLGALSGSVWLDANNNGVRDVGEGPIAGVVIQLTGTDASGAVSRSATTLADGSYRFDDLLAGTYTVTEPNQPAGTVDAVTFAGSAGGSATAVGALPSRISGIALGAGAVSTANDFSETPAVAISGRVYFDANNDGVIDGGESGIGGQTITITGTDDRGQPVSVSVTTQPDGSYSAPSLRPGTYTVTQPTQPPNSANGITTPGTGGGTATPPGTTPSAITSINLTTPGSSSTGNNFGEIPNNASIAGRVWLDRDNDGVIDAGENGIANVTVLLSGIDVNGATVNRSVQTDANGNYLFDGLLPGTYTVTEPTQPPNTGNGRTVPGSTGGTGTAIGTTPSAIATIPLAAGQASINNHFGEIPLSSLSGSVYNDRDNDGVRDADEPGYAGVVVRLTGTDDLGNPVTREVTTGPDGRYRFEGLRPGTYTVTEPNQPADTSNGITTPGSTGGTATPVGTVPSAIGGIVIGPGVDSVDNNFGEIGDTPDVVVSKSATPTRFATNAAGSYTVRVRNQGQRPTAGEILVRDRLPAGIRLTAAPSGAGWACTGAANDDRFECRSSSVIAAGSTSPNAITVPVRVAVGVANGTTLNNAVMVSGGGEPDFRGPSAAELGAFNGEVSLLPVCDPAITQNACRTPTVVVQSAALSGSVWYDIGSATALRDGGDRPLQGWTVELVDPNTGRVIATQLTGPDGRYRFADLAPGVPYVVRFREPGGVLWGFPVNGETTPNSPAPCNRDAAIANGTQSSCVRRDQGVTEIEVVLAPGRELVEQSLPVDPNGVVYDAVTRQPVPGSIVTLSPVGTCAGWNPSTQVLNATAGGYTVSGSSIAMTVGADGFYQFLFAPTTPARCIFQLTVTPPPTHTFVSTLIPPQSGTLNPPGGPTDTFRVQPQPTAPTAVPGTGTQYWLVISSGSTAPNIVHNHLPLDPRVPPGLSISKVGDRQIAEVGDSVLYTLTVRQTAGGALPQLSVLDVLPPGFTYIAGTARVDGVAAADPVGAPGPRLGFTMGAIPAGGQRVLTYRVRVGVGSQQGDGINRATAVGCGQPAGCLVPGTLDPVGGSIVSNRAEYRVRVTGGVFASEACVLGKVFVDCNRNSLQDEEELGIPGVRLYFSDGTFAITDVEGKYSYCGIEPRSATLKVDASTLPRGSVLTTSSNRNLGDANSLFLDLKNGELHRADFIEGSCSNRVLEQVRARRGNGEVRAPESEPAQPGLRFESKPPAAPQQATDGADQPAEQPRARNDGGAL